MFSSRKSTSEAFTPNVTRTTVLTNALPKLLRWLSHDYNGVCARVCVLSH
jgi:hypothetical protein